MLDYGSLHNHWTNIGIPTPFVWIIVVWKINQGLQCGFHVCNSKRVYECRDALLARNDIDHPRSHSQHNGRFFQLSNLMCNIKKKFKIWMLINTPTNKIISVDVSFDEPAFLAGMHILHPYNRVVDDLQTWCKLLQVIFCC